MKTLSYMGEQHHLLTEKEENFYNALARQFGKKDAEHLINAPEKFAHHFDAETTKAYKALTN